MQEGTGKKFTHKQAEEWTQSLALVGGGFWRQILLAKQMGVPEALGLTVKDWVTSRLGGYIRHSIAERQEAAKELTEGEGLSQREAAEVLGVDVATVNRDLSDVANATEADNSPQQEELPSVANATEVQASPKYDVLVIDPPWPMQKIDRDVRLAQDEFPYDTIKVSDLLEWEEATKRAADDCHVFLWTTQRFLFDAADCLNLWDFKYVCVFVWHKPGGFQVVGLPQYNAEFCLYARKGSPRFVDTKAFPTCFYASRGEHSEKPEEFYAMLRRVTDGKRLDMFARRKIEGFDSWGNESP
jgi:N6-adenosine-specific RNA methylase IME4